MYINIIGLYRKFERYDTNKFLFFVLIKVLKGVLCKYAVVVKRIHTCKNESSVTESDISNQEEIEGN